MRGGINCNEDLKVLDVIPNRVNLKTKSRSDMLKIATQIVMALVFLVMLFLVSLLGYYTIETRQELREIQQHILKEKASYLGEVDKNKFSVF